MTSIDVPFVPHNTEIHIAPSLGGVLSAATEIPEVAEIGDLEELKNIIKYGSFGPGKYKRSASGKKEVSDFSITINFMPGNAQHLALKTAYDGDGTIFIAIVWRFGAENYRADIEVIVATGGTGTPEDAIQQKVINFGVDGGVLFDYDTDIALIW